MKKILLPVLFVALMLMSATVLVADSAASFIFVVDTTPVDGGYFLPALTVLPPAGCDFQNYQTSWEIFQQNVAGAMVSWDRNRPLIAGFSKYQPSRRGPFNQLGLLPGIYTVRLVDSLYPAGAQNTGCPPPPQNVTVTFVVGNGGAYTTAASELVGKVGVAWNGHVRGRTLNYTAYVPVTATATFFQTDGDTVVTAMLKLAGQSSPYRISWLVPDSFDLAKPISLQIQNADGNSATYRLTEPDPAVHWLLPHGIDK